MGLGNGDDQAFLEGKLAVTTQSGKNGSPFHGSRGPGNAPQPPSQRKIHFREPEKIAQRKFMHI